LITKENLKTIITILSRIYAFNPDERIRNLIVELLRVWDKNKPNEIDLLNGLGRGLSPEKKEIANLNLQNIPGPPLYCNKKGCVNTAGPLSLHCEEHKYDDWQFDNEI
jgi:hypothetical protein